MLKEYAWLQCHQVGIKACLDSNFKHLTDLKKYKENKVHLLVIKKNQKYNIVISTIESFTRLINKKGNFYGYCLFLFVLV